MNERLKTIFEEDQKERENSQEWGKTIPFEEIKKRDTERLNETLEIIGKGKLKK